MRRARFLAIALVALGGGSASGQRGASLAIPIGGGPIEVGPVPAGIRSVSAEACGACHEDHYREWAGSAHHTSYTNALFTEEFRHRRLPSCARCHAPRPDPEAGIDCAVCHVRDGVVLNPRVSGRAPHASRASQEVAHVDACASCHEFDFDGQPGERLQRTVSEHRSSRHRESSCQSCHLAPRGARHPHDLPGGLDATLLRDAIAVTRASATSSEGTTRVRLALVADAAGHAVPTGDIFRRLVIRAWPEGDPDHAAEITLARRFRVQGGQWHEREDRRVPAAGTRTVTLELPGAPTRVEYAIDLFRAPPERARRLGWADGDVRRRLASGAVDVTRAP